MMMSVQLARSNAMIAALAMVAVAAACSSEDATETGALGAAGVTPDAGGGHAGTTSADASSGSGGSAGATATGGSAGVGGHAAGAAGAVAGSGGSQVPTCDPSCGETEECKSGSCEPLTLDGIQVFPADHVWNVTIDNLPVDPKSATYINSLGSSAQLAIYLGLPYNVVNGLAKKQKMTSWTGYAPWCDDVAYPIPENPLIEPYGPDRHLLIVHKDEKKLYELYFAEKADDGTWSAFGGAVFDLSGYALREAGWASADAAGLAMLPGLIKVEEVEAGEIKHAIRFSSSATSTQYVWPARSAGHSDDTYPPYGQKFRLKASFDLSGYSAPSQVILTAMKKYGIIYADIGGGNRWNIHGTADTRWDTAIYDMEQVVGADFEAVDESSLMIDPDSGQARSK
jgi:hypothetical protein